jgi:transcriptional regulator with XRE-family HTH domain
MARTAPARGLDRVIAALPADERAKIDARARDLIVEEMSLQRLRKAIGKTQTAVAKRLKVGQHAVSKIETRSDMHLSTLRDFINAMGGELELIAQFPDRPPVRLEALGTASLRRKRPRPARREKSGSLPAASARRSPV